MVPWKPLLHLQVLSAIHSPFTQAGLQLMASVAVVAMKDVVVMASMVVVSAVVVSAVVGPAVVPAVVLGI